MKTNSLALACVVAVTLAGPLESFAQSDTPVTRSQVKADLQQIEQAGYNPARAEDAGYPADVQAAEAHLARRDQASRAGSEGAYGSTTDSLSAHGARLP